MKESSELKDAIVHLSTRKGSATKIVTVDKVDELGNVVVENTLYQLMSCCNPVIVGDTVIVFTANNGRNYAFSGVHKRRIPLFTADSSSGLVVVFDADYTTDWFNKLESTSILSDDSAWNDYKDEEFNLKRSIGLLDITCGRISSAAELQLPSYKKVISQAMTNGLFYRWNLPDDINDMPWYMHSRPLALKAITDDKFLLAIAYSLHGYCSSYYFPAAFNQIDFIGLYEIDLLGNVTMLSNGFIGCYNSALRYGGSVYISGYPSKYISDSDFFRHMGAEWFVLTQLRDLWTGIYFIDLAIVPYRNSQDGQYRFYLGASNYCRNSYYDTGWSQELVVCHSRFTMIVAEVASNGLTTVLHSKQINGNPTWFSTLIAECYDISQPHVVDTSAVVKYIETSSTENSYFYLRDAIYNSLVYSYWNKLYKYAVNPPGVTAVGDWNYDCTILASEYDPAIGITSYVAANNGKLYTANSESLSDDNVALTDPVCNVHRAELIGNGKYLIDPGHTSDDPESNILHLLEIGENVKISKIGVFPKNVKCGSPPSARRRSAEESDRYYSVTYCMRGRAYGMDEMLWCATPTLKKKLGG